MLPCCCPPYPPTPNPPTPNPHPTQDDIVTKLQALQARVAMVRRLFKDQGQLELIIATIPTYLVGWGDIAHNACVVCVCCLLFVYVSFV